MNTTRSAHRHRNHRRDATDAAGVCQINPTARRYPAHGDHHRHPHRAKPQESQP
ncbi:hypothetical protein [Actinoplanes sp. ATCC 53533]|uniref:hypothetical protein n=1 Tax=Actinoplanes sp. ATCC 53533 TaxID=1288362 RepID=UPI0013152C3C|nr:hypothetical protein [Actinoplanes sp. ATCC 53533]